MLRKLKFGVVQGHRVSRIRLSHELTFGHHRSTHCYSSYRPLGTLMSYSLLPPVNFSLAIRCKTSSNRPVSSSSHLKVKLCHRCKPFMYDAPLLPLSLDRFPPNFPRTPVHVLACDTRFHIPEQFPLTG